MSDFNKAIEKVLKFEGVLSNDKYDAGGLTKYGISKRMYPTLDIAYRDWETDRKSTRLNSSHSGESRMPSSA